MSKIPAVLAAMFLAGGASVAMADDGQMMGELLLFQKCTAAGVCPAGPGPWPPTIPGASGELDYSYFGPSFAFEFKGSDLAAKLPYTLIYYMDPWGTGVVCLGAGTTNSKGSVHFKGKVVTGSLPSSGDANFSAGGPGAKIWLVPSTDVSCAAPFPSNGLMTAWNPGNILFEYNPIVYTQMPFTHHDD